MTKLSRHKSILILFCLMLFVSFAGSVWAQSTLLGDANGDQKIDIIDALLVARYAAALNPTGIILQNMNVNGDANIDILDALLIAQYSAGIITKFPGGQTPTPTPTPTVTGPTPSPTAVVQPNTVNTNIRLTSIGFLPDKKKEASIAASCSSFNVVRYPGNTVAFTGSITTQVSGVYLSDFSSLQTEGTYYLDVSGVGKSALFTISANVFQFPFYSVMRGFYLWRCGTAVSGKHYGIAYSHAACHTTDGNLNYLGLGSTIKDGKGGWHDAGDFGKYIVNAGITVGGMFKAWEQYKSVLQNIKLDIPESGNSLPDYLDELKYEMDWVLKMQYPDGTGKVAHKLTRLAFEGFVMPETDTEQRYYCPYGTAATADFVAMCAMAARIYKPYDATYAQKCLDAAVVSYNFLAANTGYVAANQNGFSTGAYEDSKYTDKDDRLWAAAEMWETTGEAKYLTDFESRANGYSPKIDADFDWANVKDLGMFTYLTSTRTGKNATLASQLKTELISVADGIVNTDKADPYRRPLGSSFYWGCNGGVARQAITLLTANALQPNAEYVNASLDAINHLFGRNSYCRSFVTGLGFNPPLHPHDRRSGADGINDPWPGYLVGGGQSATDWTDIQDSYQTNEIAINWNGALVYALAAFVK